VAALALAVGCGGVDDAPSRAACDEAAARLHRLRADYTATKLGRQPGFADDAPGAAAWRASEMARMSADCRGTGSGGAWSAAKVQCVTGAASWSALATCDVGVRPDPVDARPAPVDARTVAPPDAAPAPPDAAPLPPPATMAEAERLVTAYCACVDDACRRPLSTRLRDWDRGLSGPEASDDDIKAIKRRNRVTQQLTTCINQALGAPR
jgi:hypothetical protein